MSKSYSNNQRTEYLAMTARFGGLWVQVFKGQTEFYTASYWDLFRGMWSHGGPIKKTDALALMKPARSAQTAGK